MDNKLTRRSFLASAALLIPTPGQARVPAPEPVQSGKWWEEERIRPVNPSFAVELPA